MLKYFSGVSDRCWSCVWKQNELGVGQPSVKLTSVALLAAEL